MQLFVTSSWTTILKNLLLNMHLGILVYHIEIICFYQLQKQNLFKYLYSQFYIPSSLLKQSNNDCLDNIPLSPIHFSSHTNPNLTFRLTKPSWMILELYEEPRASRLTSIGACLNDYANVHAKILANNKTQFAQRQSKLLLICFSYNDLNILTGFLWETNHMRASHKNCIGCSRKLVVSLAFYCFS